MLELCTREATSEPDLQAILLSRRINHIVGGMAVTPWTVNELPDAEVEKILGMERLAGMREGRKKVQDILANWRKNHPNYRSN